MQRNTGTNLGLEDRVHGIFDHADVGGGVAPAGVVEVDGVDILCGISSFYFGVVAPSGLVVYLRGGVSRLFATTGEHAERHSQNQQQC